MPVEDLQGLEHATPDQLVNHELLGRGTGNSVPALDADFYLPALDGRTRERAGAKRMRSGKLPGETKLKV